MKPILWLSLLFFSAQYCSILFAQSKFPYQTDMPDDVFVMPKKLKEISGLGFSSDYKKLVAVQDEQGILFFLDKNTGKIVNEVEFWDAGDYEGVEIVGNEAFVVKSTGTIYRIKLERKEVEKYNFFLEQENDVEGLAYDKANNRLLLACKAKAGQGETSKTKKGIYSFDLKQLQLKTEPAFTVSQQDVLQYLSTSDYLKDKDKLLEHFDENADEFSFAPSSLAIHPLSGQIYILSSVGKLLMIIDMNSAIVHIEKLKKKIHAQPEGICFDQDGTMYIANEAKDDEPGKILVFKMK